MRVLIIDGYTDEPAGLGVPPYIDVYPRYLAGSIWAFDPHAEVIYKTIDSVRGNLDQLKEISSSCDLSVLIAGVTVPGKYLSGAPATIKDALRLPSFLNSKYTAICGPAVRFGFASGGGSTARFPRELEDLYNFVIRGDPEVVIQLLLRENFSDRVDMDTVRPSSETINEYAAMGARIIQQHPFYPDGLICEIETFRGCPRSITGGCSFCTEPLHGLPDFRSIRGITNEISSLRSFGAKNFRLGRQPDILIYGSKDQNESPAPSPRAIKRLFSSIRKVAPDLKVLHIDNVNPATIYNHPEESENALKIIVSYHTPGDVAALGIESADEEVIRRNNLKVCPEGAMLAIEIINEVGKERGENGLPHLLPGVNFVYGLPGETKSTFEINLEFMREVLGRGLMVRRINLRQVMVLPSTRMESVGGYLIKKHKRLFIEHKRRMREEIDLPMIKRVVPRWTVMREVRTELVEGGTTWARQIGSYPILVGIPKQMPVGVFTDVVVLTHGPRSVSGLTVPVHINSLTMKELEMIPGIGSKRAASLIKRRPFDSPAHLISSIDDPSLIEPLLPLMEFK
ncbi:MAG: radical SAM protein [Candidatus Methanomethyliales bacterium]|nr:radical SAM protein [Candidatus Methanomethylicales archaeon]